MRQAILRVPIEERVCSHCLKAFGANVVAACDEIQRLMRDLPRE